MQRLEGARAVVHLRVEQVLVVRPAVRQAVHRLHAEQRRLRDRVRRDRFCGKNYKKF